MLVLERGNSGSDCVEEVLCKSLKEETVDRIVWRKCFARGYGLVTRQTARRINEFKSKQF